MRPRPAERAPVERAAVYCVLIRVHGWGRMMITTYALWDDRNRFQGHYAGPGRLAKWTELPVGWTIERFLGTVSQGTVSLEDVKWHARMVEAGALEQPIGHAATSACDNSGQ